MADIDDLLAAVEAGPQGPTVGAFFDFDGTLIHGYSAALYFRQRLASREMGPQELIGTLIEVFNMQQRGHDVTRLVGVGLGALRGTTLTDLEDMGQQLFRTQISGQMYPDARRLVQAHLRAGHTVALASSATRFQAQAAAEDLGIEHLLVTEIETLDGIVTGQVDGPILWGPGKAEAVVAFAADQGLDLAESYAYGNGGEDVLYLETVGRPRPLNADSTLTRGGGGARLAGAPPAPPAAPHPGQRRPLGRLLRRPGHRGRPQAWGWGCSTGTARTALKVAAAISSELALAAAGVSLEVEGQEHLWSARPAVFVFNHQSQLDVVVLAALLRRDFTGVAKKELATDPSFAAMGWLADVAYVDRTDKVAAREALAPALESLESGTSLVIAPEGTRSPTPRVLPFKKGAFHLAMQAQVPMVPVVIRNAGEIMPAHSMLLTPGTVQVRVLAPVSTDDWTVDNLDEQVAMVERLYADTLDDW